MSKPWEIPYDTFVLEVNVEKLSEQHFVRCRYDDVRTHLDAYKSISHFLNELVWFWNVRIGDVSGGHSQVQMGLYYSANCESYLGRFKQRVFDDKQHLALAFYREADAGDSAYYRFLCYDKILQIPFAEGLSKKAWVEEQIPKLKGEFSITVRDRSIGMLEGKTLADWLYKDGRQALAHAHEGKFVRNPNNYKDWDDIKWANTVMEELASKVITEKLGVEGRGCEWD